MDSGGHRANTFNPAALAFGFRLGTFSYGGTMPSTPKSSTTKASTPSVGSLKSGQTISCTLTSVPRAEAARKTIARLMRRDPVAGKGLRKSQNVRRRTTIVYNRGNRDWVKRQLCSKHVHVVLGETWSMVYTADLANEFAAIGKYIDVKAA